MSPQWNTGAVAILVGIGLLLCPLYLPIGPADDEVRYVHAVYDVDDPSVDAVSYEELSPAEQAAFDEAYAAGRLTFADPDKRVEGLSYAGDFRYVERGGKVYEFRVDTVPASGDLVLFQELFLIPTLLLLGICCLAIGGYSTLVRPVGRFGGGGDGPDGPDGPDRPDGPTPPEEA